MWWKNVKGKRKRWTFAAVLVILITTIATARIYWNSNARLNVILVSFDTTRADRLGIYGYPHGLTSAMDDFARRGVIFENAYAPAPITLPSHATMLTGLYPPEHGLRLNGEGKLPDSVPLLSEILQKQGYDTGAFVAAFVLDRRFGLARGFDTYDDDLSKATPNVDYQERRRDGQDIVTSALSWLELRKNRPFFCWIHFYDAHGPYDARTKVYGNQFQQIPYDAGIAAELQAFDRLVSYLKDRKLDKNTLVIVTADHGEGLEEHLENEHAMLVYNSTLRVPLVFVNPRECQAGHRVAGSVSLVDLTPTILDILRIPPPAHMSGRSLRRALQGDSIESVACYGEAETPYSMNRWCPLKTVVSDRWKYIHTNRPELYDLSNDPHELTDLANTNSDRCREMRNIIESMEESFHRSKAPDVTLSESERAKLAALGYVAGGNFRADSAQVKYEDLPDVKDMLPYLHKYEKARLLGLKDEYQAAIVLLEEIVRDRPDYSAASLLLANYLFNLERYDEAVVVYRAVIAQRPNFLSARMNLARTFATQSRFDEAANELREVIKLEPEDSFPHFQLAQVLASLQQFDEAIFQYKEAIRNSPNYVPAHFQFGKLLVQLNRSKEAVPYFQRAVDMEPTNGNALANLIKLLVQFGDYETALTYCQRSAKLLPPSFDIHLNLGLLLTLNKRFAEGLVELRDAQRMRPNDPRPAQLIQQAESAIKRSEK